MPTLAEKIAVAPLLPFKPLLKATLSKHGIKPAKDLVGLVKQFFVAFILSSEMAVPEDYNPRGTVQQIWLSPRQQKARGEMSVEEQMQRGINQELLDYQKQRNYDYSYNLDASTVAAAGKAAKEGAGIKDSDGGPISIKDIVSVVVNFVKKLGRKKKLADQGKADPLTVAEQRFLEGAEQIEKGIREGVKDSVATDIGTFFTSPMGMVVIVVVIVILIRKF